MHHDTTPAFKLQRKYFRAVLIIGLLAITAIVAMPFLGEVGMTSGATASLTAKWIGFLGAFHPLLLHLPIGALLLVILMEVIALFTSGKYKTNQNTTLGLLFAAASGIFSVVFGYFLYLTGDYPITELMEEHKRDGILFTIFLIATFLIKYTLDLSFMVKISRPFYAMGLVLSTLTMISAGHHGAEISHGDPLDKAPWREKTKQTSIPAGADPIIYTNIIHPILESKCIKCHGPKKQKSGLRMDSYAALLEGGEETDCLVPGDIEKSTMISYLHLSLDDDLRMPPEEKKQLTPEEIQILEWWVHIGAPEHAKLSETKPAREIKQLLENITPES